MKKKEITEGNKLIAEFMGYFTKSIEFAKRKKIKYDWKKDSVEIQALKYHYDWAWLMPVVLKIEKEAGAHNNFTIYQYDVHISAMRKNKKGRWHFRDFEVKGKTKEEATWKGAVKFISWYNKYIK